MTLTTPEALTGYFGDAEVRVLAGCAPCQPFSTYAQRYDPFAEQEDEDGKPKETPRWALMNRFATLVEETLPEIVTMENVPTVTKHTVYHDFVTKLESLGYEVWHEPVDCSEYGLPQRRRRRVLLASRLGKIELIAPTHTAPVTVTKALEGMSDIAAGESAPGDQVHAPAGLSPINLKRIQASREGGTWRDWPEDLRAPCHRKKSGKTYPAVYGRMRGDEPAPTLTTQFYGFGSGRFGHPTQHRAISLREGAILQGFPKTYSFLDEGGSFSFKTLGRMIGNAVPVTLGRVIGRSITKHLEEVRQKSQPGGDGMAEGAAVAEIHAAG